MSDLHVKVNQGLNALFMSSVDIGQCCKSQRQAWCLGGRVSCLSLVAVEITGNWYRKSIIMQQRNSAQTVLLYILSYFSLKMIIFFYPLICLLCACPFPLCCQALYHIQTESPSPPSSHFPPLPSFPHPFNFCKGCPPEFFGPQSAPEQPPGWLCAIFQPLCALCSCGPHCEDFD